MDIALVWDPATGRADLAMDGPDLLIDTGLRTAVIVSLFSDRLADPSDTLPDTSGDRRGWIGDAPIAGAADRTTPDLTGSKFWLRERSKQTDPIARQLERDAGQALAWMTQDGVAGSITANATLPRRGWVVIDIQLGQAGASHRFDLPWQNS